MPLAHPMVLPLRSKPYGGTQRGDWDKAHDCAQAVDDADGALVHAYLHRKEGDPGNAGYWYRRAGRPPFTGDLAAEWYRIAAEFLAHRG